MKNRIAIICLLGCFVLLSACGQSATEKIHTQLEASVTEESAFNKSQKNIAKLEKAEQKIFKEITNLDMDQFDEVKKLSKKAITNIEKRTAEIKSEKTSIDSSHKEFKKVKNLIDDLEQNKAKKQAKQMYKAMNTRYKSYGALNKEYRNSLIEEKKFYKLLSQKNAKADKVNKQLDLLNRTYENLIKKNKQFNEETKKYNELKEAFYKTVDLDVDYGEKN